MMVSWLVVGCVIWEALEKNYMRIEEKCFEIVTDNRTTCRVFSFAISKESKAQKWKKSRIGKLGNKSSVIKQHFSFVHFILYNRIKQENYRNKCLIIATIIFNNKQLKRFNNELYKDLNDCVSITLTWRKKGEN